MGVEYYWEIEGAPDRPVTHGPVRPAPAGRRWQGLLLVCGLLALGFWLGWDQVQTIQAHVERETRLDAERSFQLALAALETGDEELFTLVLPGNELAWTATQQRLFQESALFDRTPFGMNLSEAPAHIITTSLSPDLRRATVLTAQSYVLAGERAPAGEVTLQFTTFLEQGSGNWAWQEPGESFWGVNRHYSGERVHIAYPERDEQLVRRLAADIDAEVEALCRQLAQIHCPAGVVLTIQLVTDPAVFLALAAGQSPRGVQGELRLPTPTLIGRPVDETAYQAIRRGYAAQLAVAMVKNIIGWECSNPLDLYLAAQEGRLVC